MTPTYQWQVLQWWEVLHIDLPEWSMVEKCTIQDPWINLQQKVNIKECYMKKIIVMNCAKRQNTGVSDFTGANIRLLPVCSWQPNLLGAPPTSSCNLMQLKPACSGCPQANETRTMILEMKHNEAVCTERITLALNGSEANKQLQRFKLSHNLFPNVAFSCIAQRNPFPFFNTIRSFLCLCLTILYFSLCTPSCIFTVRLNFYTNQQVTKTSLEEALSLSFLVSNFRFCLKPKS